MDLARESSTATDYTVPMFLEGMCVTVVGSAGLVLAGVAALGWLIGGVRGGCHRSCGCIRCHAAGATVSEASSLPSRV